MGNIGGQDGTGSFKALIEYYLPNVDKNTLVAWQIYVFTFTAYFSRAIWEGSIISSFVYLITDASNMSIGNLTGTLGFTQLFVAPVMGYLSDNIPRTWILMLASFIGIFATVLTLYAVQMGDYFRLLHAMVAWGFFWGCTTPTIDALLADTIDAGKRSEAYTFRSSLLNVATSFGPLIASFLFYFIGDHWKLNELKLVMSIGLSCFVVPTIILFSFHFVHNDQNSDEVFINIRQKLGGIIQYFRCFGSNGNVSLLGRFRDEKQRKVNNEMELIKVSDKSSSSSIGEKSNKIALNYTQLSLQEQEEDSTPQHSSNVDCEDGITSSNVVDKDYDGGNLKENESTSLSNNHSDSSSHNNSDNTTSTSDSSSSSNTRSDSSGEIGSAAAPSYLFIASMIAGGDMLTGLASGMTIKFFPIFFMTVLKLTPLKLSLMYFICPLATTFFAQGTQKLGLRWGRIITTLFMKSCGISLMVLLATLAIHREKMVSSSNQKDLSSYFPSDISVIDNCLLFIWVIRTASMNCSKGLTKSIVMDIVPKDQRGRWNALESINNATFSGSAILGGYLVDKYGFVHNFLCTAALQTIACIPLIIIRNKVSNET